MTDLSQAEIQAQAAELLKSLDTTYRPDLAAEPRYNRYHRAAAVLTSFEPLTLQPAPGPGAADGAERRALVQDSIRMKASARGQADESASTPNAVRYVLKPDVRRAVLEEMATREAMLAALEANPARETTPVQAMLEAYIRGDAPSLSEQDATQLAGAFQVAQWLGGLLPGVPAREDVQRRWDYLDLVRPFDFLAGSKFRGREAELDRLRDYVLGRPAADAGRWQPPLVIYGPGGVGKSALSAKFVQDNAAKPEDERFPWAYMDFDRTILDPEEPLTIVIEAVRQLAVQHPEQAERLRKFQDYLRDMLEGSVLRAQEMNRPASKQANIGRALELEGWSRYLPDFASLLYSLAGDRPFMLVLDTFEEVQYRSSRVVRRLFDFLRALQEKAPQTRPVLAGRNPVQIDGYEVINVQLKDFAPDTARSLLESEGVPSDVATDIVTQVGGSPLSLWLALELWRRSAADVVNAVPLEFRLQEGLVQGQLFTRILGHIHDDDVRALAHPGLVLRRITPDIIRNVLARYCNFRVRDDAQARRLFDLLAREEALVTVEGDVLRHRSDVRRIMLGLLRHQSEEEGARVRRIEKAAVRYYSARETAEERAEEIYHRLSLGQSARLISERWADADRRGWTEQMRRFLFNAREELGPAQRAWLAARLGFELTPDEEKEADQASWEQDVERKARDYLEYKKPEQALDAMLARPHWLPGSPLHLLAVQAWMAQQRWDEAARAARRGFDSAAAKRDRTMAMQLGLLGAVAEMRLGNCDAADGRLDEVAALAEPGDDLRRLEVDLLRRAVALAGGRTADVAAAEEALRERFDAFSEDRSVRDPAVVAWLAGELGAKHPRVMAKALRLIGYEIINDAALHRLVIALAEWDVAASKGAGEPPGALLRQMGAHPDPAATPSQMWRSYFHASKPDALGRSLAALLEAHPDAPQDVLAGLAEGMRLRAGDRAVSPEIPALDVSVSEAVIASDAPETKSASRLSGPEANRLSGPQAKRLRDALLDAFDPPGFDEMLMFRLNRRRETLSLSGSFPEVVYQVLAAAQREGWITELIQAAYSARPDNAALGAVAAELGLGPQVAGDDTLERLVERNTPSVDVNEWRGRLNRLESQVCRVEIGGRPVGTGFLLGPEAVMTAVDVVQPLSSGHMRPGDVAVRFDYKASPDGAVLNAGRLFPLAEDGLLDFSPADELGYALLRVHDRPGYTPIGGERVESYAELRYWMRVPEPAPQLAPDAPMVLLYYPPDAPLQVSFQEGAVIAPGILGDHVKYRNPVGSEAAGAPGFDADLNLAVLHLGCGADGCTGAPIAQIIERLRANGMSRWLGEQATAL
jgi:hypothetical protein